MDEKIRKAWLEQNQGHIEVPRAVKVTGGFVMHPDDKSDGGGADFEYVPELPKKPDVWGAVAKPPDPPAPPPPPPAPEEPSNVIPLPVGERKEGA